MYELIVLFNKYILVPLKKIWNKLLNKTISYETAFEASCLKAEHGDKITTIRNRILIAIGIGVLMLVIKSFFFST